MPANKKNQHPPKCVTRQLLETLSIKDLAQAQCGLISKQCNDPGPSNCGQCECEEDDSGPGCCSADRTSKEARRSCPRREVKSLLCEPECKAPELDAMINDIRSYRDFFRKLALDAENILEQRNSQHDSCFANDPQNERHAQKQNMPSETCCKHTVVEDNRIEPNKRAKPMVQKSNSVCSKTQMFAPTRCSSLKGQSTSNLHAMPSTPPRSPFRNVSVPLAQTAYKVKEGQLSKGNKDGNTTPEGKNKKNICGNLFQKLVGKKRSDCSCDEEMLNRTSWTSPNEEMKQYKDKKPDCFCDEKATNEEIKQNKDKKADCFCEENATNEEIKQNKDKKADCFCDEKATKGNKPRDEQNKENRSRINSVEVTSVNLANTTSKDENACPCCFPPAYNQYFNCTGQVSGHCCCNKSV